MEKEKFSLKDHLFNETKITQLSSRIFAVYSAFEHDLFVRIVVGRFPDLELKARISWISENLRRFLPSDYREAVSLLLASLPAPNDPSKTDDDFGEFIYAPYAEFVALYGCRKEDLLFSLEALKEITTRFSAEYAIRNFINAFPVETMDMLSSWSTDAHYHVRRWVSEGTRPKLPWAQKVGLRPEQTIPLLDVLFCDSTRYVTRSVANHLNDISKMNPGLVLETLARWKKSKKQKPAEMNYMIRHALRTLVKAGHSDTLIFLGYSPVPAVELVSFELISERVVLGEAVEFQVSFLGLQSESLIVDYILHFPKGSKTFKLKQLDVAKDQTLIVTKRHPLRANMSTRKLNPGEHQIEIQVNGKKMGMKKFSLVGS